MKQATHLKVRTIVHAARALLLAVTGSFLLLPLAKGAITINVSEVDGDVVAEASGSADIDGLERLTMDTASASIAADSASIALGSGGYEGYPMDNTGPAAFGSGNFISANSSSGEFIGVSQSLIVLVPSGYSSGDPISSTATWENTTVADLGADTGTYEWTWGSGPNADSLTLAIVPEPSTHAAWAGIFAMGLIFWQRRR